MMGIQKRVAQSGFALLNVLLGVSLLGGVIFLIMHAMSNYHAEQNSRAIGEALAPIVVELLTKGVPGDNGNYALVPATSTICGSTRPLLTDIPAGYLQSLQVSGFDLVNAACVEVKG